PYEVTYPQDVRNCVKCHRSTATNPVPLADNWKSQPSKRACGACHDDISFVNPPPNGRRLHTGGEIAQDGNCLLCHSANAPASELIPDFAGSPSAYFAFAVPQDGKTTPGDFNASGSAYIRNVWNGSGTCSNVPATATTTPTGAGTLTGPDSSGYYTMQLKCVVIPANASMLTGGIGYTYNLGTVNASDSTLNFINNNQPLTQINLPAYPYTPNDPNGGKGG